VSQTEHLPSISDLISHITTRQNHVLCIGLRIYMLSVTALATS
jgi:hypothetical protein